MAVEYKEIGLCVECFEFKGEGEYNWIRILNKRTNIKFKGECDAPPLDPSFIHNVGPYCKTILEIPKTWCYYAYFPKKSRKLREVVNKKKKINIRYKRVEFPEMEIKWCCTITFKKSRLLNHTVPEFILYISKFGFKLFGV